MSNTYGEKPPLSYNKYLRVQDLINLQDLLSDPAHHDELLFITVHQAYELVVQTDPARARRSDSVPR